MDDTKETNTSYKLEITTSDPLIRSIGDEVGFTEADFKRLDMFWDAAFNNSWLYLSSEIIHEHFGYSCTKSSAAEFYKRMEKAYTKGTQYKEVTKDDPVVLYYKELYSKSNPDKKQDARGGNLKKYYLITGAAYKKMCMRANTTQGDASCDYYIKVEELAKRALMTLLSQKDAALSQKDNLLEENQQRIAKLEKRQVRLNSFVRNIKRLESNQVFYLATTANYAPHHLYEYGGVANLADMKARFQTYNTGRAEGDLIYAVKVYRCHSYTCLEKLTGTVLAQFKDKKDGQKEMVRLKYDHLLGVMGIIIDGCDQAIDHVNRMCQQFLNEIIDTDGDVPPPVDLDALIAADGGAPVKVKRSPPRPDVSKMTNEQVFTLLEEILNTCVQRDLEIPDYLFREHKNLTPVTVAWNLITPYMRLYRGFSMTQWKEKVKLWLKKEKPSAITLTGPKDLLMLTAA